jgi:hypothetical protein
MYLKKEDSVKILELNNSSFIFDEVKFKNQFYFKKSKIILIFFH